jgi:hypothetical protein
VKKFLVRVERAAVKVALKPEFRPLEHDLAVRVARSVLVRVGASSLVIGFAVELIDKFVV